MKDEAGGKQKGESFKEARKETKGWSLSNSPPPPVAPSKPVKAGERPVLSLEQATKGSSEHYLYTNPKDGLVDLLVVRFDVDGKKKFMQGQQVGPDEYKMKAPPAPSPLYNRQRVSKSDTVIVV
ncbi:MAG: hypothetical protein IIB87_03565, partial [Chloroflexi bacterium]|nr:hypothetical protein [Chloroflexota bacterium]